MSTTTRYAALALVIAATVLAGPPDPVAPRDLIHMPGAPTAAVVTDADRDGAVDLLVAVASGPRLVLLRGDGAGAFAPAAPLVPTPVAVEEPAPVLSSPPDFGGET